ncbi:LysR family transcriptional regulator [Pseudorhodoplanes sinuspersici]|uniref:LysR family transcriptional regulator n=1 Tax=Pseudorhodoplanes sinuspersici TaxID=1235591 RepID=A0A1W6ZT82_9HYPH|nr:LysR family transcriptional regulator [Pseudorhodoplanes sinuspersici]ARQ00562.1 LysR family transcriptional regulator [Pseudorhodoplanes sinuspersici]RKE72158.1 LysR family transcriptional regulator [Pseudorhodoplanes sinuspersici]
MNLSLRQLRYVVAAADSGHVTDAARRLNVSQPSISSAIAELEAEIGVPLFIRHHARGVTLTPVGERVVNEARLLLKHAQDFTQNAIELGDALKGEISVGCFLTLAIRFMPGLLAGFAQKYPGITVQLQEGDQEEMISMMQAGRIELALAYNLAVPDEIDAEPLIDLPPYAIVAANHPLARRRSISLKDLAEEPFILLDLPHSRDYFFGLFRAVGLSPRIVFRSRSQELIRGLVAHGHGFAIQNAIPATTIAYDGNSIAVLALDETLPPTRIMTLRLKHYATRPAVQAFQDYVHTAFSTSGIFAPGSITPPRVNPVKRR